MAEVKREKKADEVFCHSCGELIKKEAEICPKCGVRQRPMSINFNKRVTAGILAILLGSFGVHKFYLGDTGLGILYLCFFWTGLPGIAGLIEGALIL
ncbi:MAG: TM2 domain-containing protein, partial [Halobacteriota archaeon]|nr:TM2 domain-containing protein [Halobacteriota archaeon]